MDNFDLTAFETGTTPVPINSYELPGGEKVTVLDGTVIVNKKFIIGDPPNYPSSLGTSYEFPGDIGVTGQVLTVDAAQNELDFNPQSGGGGPGGGDIFNGGQPGAVTIGPTTADDLTLFTDGGKIFVGSNNDTDDIHLQGGIRFRYRNVMDTVPPGGSCYEINISDYFVEISGSGINQVKLPDADGTEGHVFVISKGYVGGVLCVRPSSGSGDTIDGKNMIELRFTNQRLKVISSGTDRWLIL